MTKEKVTEGAIFHEKEDGGSDAVKTERVTRLATFNVMQSSEISKVLRELTQCVANERDFFIHTTHEQKDLLNPGKQEPLWEILPRSDISCSEVSGSTTTNFSLDLGPEMVRTSQTYTCADCGKHFSKKDFLQKHRIVHEEPRHRCVVCDKSFVREDKLKRHFVSIHSKHRPHVCSICAKAFARKDKLKDHQKHHLTACDSFLCLECRIPFVQKSDLNKHTRGSHSGPSVKKEPTITVSTAVIPTPPVIAAILQVRPIVVKPNKPRSKKSSKSSRFSRTTEMSSVNNKTTFQSPQSLPQNTSSHVSLPSNSQTMSMDQRINFPQSLSHHSLSTSSSKYFAPSSLSEHPLSAATSHNSLLASIPPYIMSTSLSQSSLSPSLPQYHMSSSLAQNALSTFSQYPISTPLSQHSMSTSLSQYHSSSSSPHYPTSMGIPSHSPVATSSQHPPLSNFLQNYHNYSYPFDQHSSSLISTVFPFPSNDSSTQLRSPPATLNSEGNMLLAAQQHMAYSYQQQSPNSQQFLRYYPYLQQQRMPFVNQTDSSRQVTTNIYPYMPF